MKDTIINHPRNNDIAFNANKHEYTYKSDTVFNGVTSLIGEYTKPFNAKEVATNLSSWHPKWKQYTVDEILDMWNDAREYGNYVDEVFDNWLNFGIDLGTPELGHIKEALKEKGLTPLINEWVVYDETINVASAIDMVCEKDGKLVIVDLKSMENPIKKTSYKNVKMSYPLNSLMDCRYYKYTLQVGLYKYWLEKRYNLPVSDEKYILRIRPEFYEWIPLQDVELEIEKLYKFKHEN